MKCDNIMRSAGNAFQSIECGIVYIVSYSVNNEISCVVLFKKEYWSFSTSVMILHFTESKICV